MTFEHGADYEPIINWDARHQIIGVIIGLEVPDPRVKEVTIALERESKLRRLRVITDRMANAIIDDGVPTDQDELFAGALDLVAEDAARTKLGMMTLEERSLRRHNPPNEEKLLEMKTLAAKMSAEYRTQAVNFKILDPKFHPPISIPVPLRIAPVAALPKVLMPA